MVRPKRRDAEPITLNLDREILTWLKEHKSEHQSLSLFVDDLLRAVIKGPAQQLSKQSAQLADLQAELKVLREEKERLEKENERLKKQVTKLTVEVEKWRKKWDGQKTLDKWTKKQNELKQLVDMVLPHLEEGKRWREVMEELEILEMGAQVDILNKLFIRSGGNEEYLPSKYLRGWVLERTEMYSGVVEYKLRQLESIPSWRRRYIEEVTT